MDDVSITVDGEIQGPEERVEMSATAAVGDVRVAHKNAFRAGLLCIWVSLILVFKASEEKPPENLWNAYALVSFIIFEIGLVLLLLSMLLPHQPRIVGVAKTLVWVAFGLVQVVIGLKMSAHVAY